MRSVAAFLLFLLLAIPSAGEESGVASSQQAEQLDRLFGELQKKNVGAKALQIERQIWDLWMHSGSEADNKALEVAGEKMGLGDFRQAEIILNQLITNTRDFAEAYNRRATLYYLMGKYDASLADIVQTLDLEPRHFGALSGRGMILSKLGKPRDALRAYREALHMNPHMPGPAQAVQQLEKLEPEL